MAEAETINTTVNVNTVLILLLLRFFIATPKVCLRTSPTRWLIERKSTTTIAGRPICMNALRNSTSILRNEATGSDRNNLRYGCVNAKTTKKTKNRTSKRMSPFALSSVINDETQSEKKRRVRMIHPLEGKA